MARARNLKPDFFKDAELVECPFWVRLLFAGLWTVADREGRLLDRPKQIKMDLFPADPVDVEDGLAQLHERGLIVRYGVGGARYVQVTNFGKHQNPHVKEPASTIPPVPEKGQEPGRSDGEPGGPGAGNIAPGDMPGASTVQVPDSPGARPADSLNPIPDSPIPFPEKDGAPAPSGAYGLFVAMCEETGADEAQASEHYKRQQCAIAKRLLAAYDEDKVRRFIRYLRSMTWRTAPIDLAAVERGIGAWATAGEPATEPPRGKQGRASPPSAVDWHDVDAVLEA